MTIEIKDFCIRCGLCVGLYPEMFAHNFEDDCIDVIQEPDTEELIEVARSAVRDCAVTAIFLHDGDAESGRSPGLRENL